MTLNNNNDYLVNFFKLKNEAFDDVGITYNRASSILSSVDLFKIWEDFINNYVDQELLFIYVSTLNKEETKELYDVLENRGDYLSFFKVNVEKILQSTLTHEQKAKATLVVPLSALSHSYMTLCKDRIERRRLIFHSCEELDALTSFAALLTSLKELFDYYPSNYKEADYALELTLKYVSENSINDNDAKAFMTFMSQLPFKYRLIGLENTVSLKEKLNEWINRYTPYKNTALSSDQKKLILAYLDDKEYLVIQKQREAINQKLYTLPLAEYIKLFDTFKSETDLQEAGLWGKEVSVKEGERIAGYKHLLKDHTKGTIGWSYPVTASIFDMSVEIPVVFEKIDGDEISLGIPLELVELHKKS